MLGVNIDLHTRMMLDWLRRSLPHPNPPLMKGREPENPLLGGVPVRAGWVDLRFTPNHLLPLQPIFLNQQFSNLHGIQRSTLADLIAAEP
jgi:hypothetical protein